MSVEASESVTLTLADGESATGNILDAGASPPSRDGDIDAVMLELVQTVADSEQFVSSDFSGKTAYQAFGMVQDELPGAASSVLSDPRFDANEAVKWYESFKSSDSAADLF
jgi:hypothetical protein